MANKISITSSSTYDGRKMTLYCEQVPDIASNTSTINWHIETTGGKASYYSTGPTTVSINGSSAYLPRKNWDTEEFPAAKGDSWGGSDLIRHDSEGKATISVSLTTAIYSTATKTDTVTWTLDTIPQKATIWLAPNFTDEDNPTLYYTNNAKGSVTTLQACISLEGNLADIAYRDIDKLGSSYVFNLTDAERTLLRNATTGKSRTVSFHVKTVIDGQTFYDSVKRTFSIVNGEPVINPTVVDTKAFSIGLTGDANKMVKYLSKMSYTIGASAVKGATLVSQYVTCEGRRQNTATGSYDSLGSNVFEFVATDSRGFTTKKTVTVPMVNYIPKTINVEGNILLNEVDGTKANITIDVNGNYFNGSFGKVSNSLTLSYKLLTDNPRTEIATGSLTPSLYSGSYTASITLPNNLDYKTGYIVTVTAKDAVNSITGVSKTLKAVPVFDWSKEDFNFNVPVSIEHKPIADFVIEQGTSNGWDYRKWKSGKAECWKTVTLNAAVGNEWGSLYTSNTKISRQSYPFTFKTKPKETATLTSGTYAAWIYCDGNNGSGVNGVSSSAIYGVCKPTASAAADYYITLYVFGEL